MKIYSFTECKDKAEKMQNAECIISEVLRTWIIKLRELLLFGMKS